MRVGCQIYADPPNKPVRSSFQIRVGIVAYACTKSGAKGSHSAMILNWAAIAPIVAGIDWTKFGSPNPSTAGFSLASWCIDMWSNLRILALGLTLVLALFASACGSDSATSTSCSTDDDCALGTVCGANNTCIQAACEFCTGDQICYRTDENPAGTCSKPECTSDDDCAEGSCREFQCSTSECTSDADCGAGETCTLAGTCETASCSGPDDCATGTFCGASGTCESGCDANDDCGEGQACDVASNTCVAGCMGNDDCAANQQCVDSACVCTPGGCAAGQYCDQASGACLGAASCDQITCPQGQVCNADTLACEAGCTAGSCQAANPNEVCDLQSGQCIPNTCPGQDPNQCMGNAQRPQWDAAKCFCAECLTDNDCNTAAGETCTAGGSCFACETACDAQTPGTCGQSQYCIEDCCVDCVGAADCAAGELCIEGSCAPEPDCTQDPSVCPNGYECVNGSCNPPNTNGTTCDPTDPTNGDCPQGTFCNPDGTCGLPGGGNFCGFCNADCTCSNGLTCNGFLCEGCMISITDPTGGCPAGNICLPLDPVGICFPLG